MALISSVFSCFSANTRNPPRAAAHAATRNKKPGAACRPGAGVVSGVVSVNIFFWKILVTRVKRKMGLALSPSFGTGSRLTLRSWLTRYLALHRDQLVIGYARGDADEISRGRGTFVSFDDRPSQCSGLLHVSGVGAA